MFSSLDHAARSACRFRPGWIAHDWGIGANAHDASVAPYHSVLAQPALAFQRLGHRLFQSIQNDGLMVICSRHFHLPL